VDDPVDSETPAGTEPDGRVPGQLWRAVRRDPLHLPEQLVLIAQGRLAAPSLDWAATARRRRPEATVGELAEHMRTEAARFGRTNGALAGTPFLLALVPAYASVLWEEARMVMRIAALNGRDPREPGFAAELLSLRGLYETPEAANDALAQIGASSPGEIHGVRARVSTGIRLIVRVLILAGFLSARGHAPTRPRRPLIVRAIPILASGLIFVITWVIPVTFMIAMSWSCENDTRKLGDRAILYYGEEPAERKKGLKPAYLRTTEPGSSRRNAVRAALLVLSLAIPLALLTVAVARPVNHARLVAISGLIGLTLVIALSARAARR
jgi:hypothetical protein